MSSSVRVRERDAALAALTEPGRAGILITGPAGVGKTYLAEEVARAAESAGLAVLRTSVLTADTEPARTSGRSLVLTARNATKLPPGIASAVASGVLAVVSLTPIDRAQMVSALTTALGAQPSARLTAHCGGPAAECSPFWSLSSMREYAPARSHARVAHGIWGVSSTRRSPRSLHSLRRRGEG